MPLKPYHGTLERWLTLSVTETETVAKTATVFLSESRVSKSPLLLRMGRKVKGVNTCKQNSLHKHYLSLLSLLVIL
jgi:hypothetical protein